MCHGRETEQMERANLLSIVRIIQGTLISTHDQDCISVPGLVLLVLRISPASTP